MTARVAIDELPAASTPLGEADVTIIQQSGVTKKATVGSMALAGPVGPAGPEGPAGPIGPAGAGVQIKGVLLGVDTPLPSSPTLGDMWVVGNPVPAVVPAPGTGAGPSLYTVVPPSIDVGQTGTIVLTGAGFAETAVVRVYGSFILPTGVTYISPSELHIDMAVSNLNGSANLKPLQVANDPDGPWSNSITLTVNAIPLPATTTALASSDTTTEAGDSVVFTATVLSGGSPVSGGTMSFRRGTNTMIAGVEVDGAGVATFTTSALPVGSWAITAVYDGGDTYQDSTSNTVTQTVSLAGGPAPTTAALVSNDASSLPGQVVVFTVTVRRTVDNVPVASGTVTFKNGGSVLIAGVAINPANGQASYTTSALAIGTHVITAEYTGGGVYLDAVSNEVSQVVAAGSGGSPIAQAVTVSKPVTLPGEPVTICSTVTSGTSKVNFGTVTFKEGATTLGVGSLAAFFGEWELTLIDLPIGVHEITAHYVGAPSYENDVSSTVTIEIVASMTDPGLTWEQAIATENLAVISNWYDFHTGYLTDGFEAADLWNPAGGGDNDPVTVNAAWLSANAGANVVNDTGSHWIVTGLRTSKLVVDVSNVTFEHCLVNRVDYANEWGSGVEVLGARTLVVFNNCTIMTDGTASESSWGDAMDYVQDTPTPNGLTFNYCEVTQWRAGFLTWHGTVVNYCWVHDLNLFGADPHNTSGSIRGRYTQFYRDYFADGTSSNVSLYADTNPYTDFAVLECVFSVPPTHANNEVNFPTRSTGWSPLLPGYVRRFNGNVMELGIAGDNQYWSEILGNRRVDGDPLFGGASISKSAGIPSNVMGFSTGINAFGAEASLTTYHYTPSPSSAQLCWMTIGRAGHNLDPNTALTDESGMVWVPVPGAETPVEPGGSPVYGVGGTVWKAQTSAAAQNFRRLTIDPYTGSTSKAYMAGLMVELTGLASVVLAQAPALATSWAPGFGTYLSSAASGVLAANATPGNYVLFFIGWSHDVDGNLAPPAGWNLLGNNFDERMSAACLWRKDFAGKSLTIPSFTGDVTTVVSVLMEVVA